MISKRGIVNIASNSKVRDSIAVRVGNIDRIEPISKFYFFDFAKNEVRNKIRELNYTEEIKRSYN